MFTKNLSQISKDDTEIAGGKGASLGEMIQANIPVPPGFVILTYGFDLLLHSASLIAEIETTLDQVNHQDTHSVEQASEKIQALILNTEIPKEIEDDTIKSFHSLKAPLVAVRSSATVEDSLSSSWAGELETYLNTTKATLLENVKKCWASLFSPRAIFYRFEKGLYQSKISVAVVVQKMINSETAGVAFSVHPVTEDKNQLIIEAGFGLGEAIVSGSITPDSYIVDKQNFSIIDINISQQDRKLVKVVTGGNKWMDVAANETSLQKLSNKQIVELAKLIIKIERHYRFPVDVEWAIEKNQIFITQSRPITTLSNSAGSGLAKLD